MALRVFNKIVEINPGDVNEAVDFLRRSTLAAIKEYETVWCCSPRLDKRTGLSCYHPEGKGIPPETEASHFNAILKSMLRNMALVKKNLLRNTIMKRSKNQN